MDIMCHNCLKRFTRLKEGVILCNDCTYQKLKLKAIGTRRIDHAAIQHKKANKLFGKYRDSYLSDIRRTPERVNILKNIVFEMYSAGFPITFIARFLQKDHTTVIFHLRNAHPRKPRTFDHRVWYSKNRERLCLQERLRYHKMKDKR